MNEKLHQMMKARRNDARAELLERLRMMEEVVLEMEMEEDDLPSKELLEDLHEASNRPVEDSKPQHSNQKRKRTMSSKPKPRANGVDTATSKLDSSNYFSAGLTTGPGGPGRERSLQGGGAPYDKWKGGTPVPPSTGLGSSPQNPSSGGVVGPVGGMVEPEPMGMEPNTWSPKNGTGGRWTSSGGANYNQQRLNVEDGNVNDDENALMENMNDCDGSGPESGFKKVILKTMINDGMLEAVSQMRMMKNDGMVERIPDGARDMT